jgi:hypothetical protein
MLENLRELVREALELRERGASFPKLSRLQGMIDGTIRVLLDAGLATHGEVLTLVAEERTRRLGPALHVIEPDSLAVA